MGTAFFWFYDIVILAIIIGIIFKCARKGFVATLLGMVSLVVAFIASWFLSEVISVAVYNNIVRKPLEDKITSSLSDVMENTTGESLSKIDVSKILVNGKPISELNLTPDNAGKINIDLSSLDCSATGISEVDLSMFGIDSQTTDFSAIDAGNIQITEAELEKNSVGTLILANSLASKAQDGGNDFLNVVSGISDLVSQTLPKVMPDGLTTPISSDNNTVVKDIILIIMSSNSENVGQAVLNNFVAPLILAPMRVIIFALLFIIIMIVLGIVVKCTKMINKIPVLGKFNQAGGALLGIAEGAIVVFIVALGIQLIVTVSGNSLMVLNDMTIEKTFIFKYIYNFEFLNLLR